MNPVFILHIETSTTVCSVALSRDKDCLFNIRNDEGLNHAALLSRFIEKAFTELRRHAANLDAVAVSAGPGSYTGLRIGVSTAKGLCYGLNIPLIAIDTLALMCVPVIRLHPSEQALFCPMIDARRMEVYTALYDKQGALVRSPWAEILTESSFADCLASKRVYFFGNGSDKSRPLLSAPNACFVEAVDPLAENMIELAWEHFRQKNFVDTAYYEPFYLKEFQATTPRQSKVGL